HGLFDEPRYVEFVEEMRMAVTLRDITDGCGIEDEEEHMGHVELPYAAKEQGRAGNETLPRHSAPVHECRGVSGDEDKDIRRIAEAVIASREPRNGVVGNVVQEDRPISEPPEQIETQIPATRRVGRRARYGFGVA